MDPVVTGLTAVSTLTSFDMVYATASATALLTKRFQSRFK
jgi:hypothetical protein